MQLSCHKNRFLVGKVSPGVGEMLLGDTLKMGRMAQKRQFCR